MGHICVTGWKDKNGIRSRRKVGKGLIGSGSYLCRGLALREKEIWLEGQLGRKAQGPEFDLQNPCFSKRLCMVACMHLISVLEEWKKEEPRFVGLLVSQPPLLASEPEE